MIGQRPEEHAMPRKIVVIADSQAPASDRRTAFPSLAVVPYFVMQDGLLDHHFARCVTWRVTQTLQQLKELRVTSPASTLSLHPGLTVAEIGRRLKVDYVLKGQILRAEQTLYFSQRLYDIRAGGLMVEAELECGLGQLEEFERSILARVTADVRLPIQENEIDRIMGKRPSNSSAYELVVRAQVAMHDVTRRRFDHAHRLLTRAQQLDPTYATAFAWMARYHSIRIGQGWTKDRQAEAMEAMRMAQVAIDLDGENAVALATAGHLMSYLHQKYEEGERRLRQAIDACPNEPLGWLLLSATLAYTNRATEAREHAEYALTLSPLDTCMYAFLTFHAISCYAQGDYEAAIDSARQSLALNETYSTTYKVLVAALVGTDNVAEARDLTRHLKRMEPSYTAARAASTAPFQDPTLRNLYLRQLRTAGCFDAAMPRPRRRAR